MIKEVTGKRSQYRSVIFYVCKEQEAIAKSVVNQLKEKGFEVCTEILPAVTFYKAEDYHQNYYNKKGRKDCEVRYKKKF